MDAVSQGSAAAGGGQGGANNKDLYEETARAEQEIRKIVQVGWNTSLGFLRQQVVEHVGLSAEAFNRALMVLQRREVVMFRNGGASVYRIGA